MDKDTETPITWDKDPEILAHLSIVAAMMIQGATIDAITKGLGLSVSAAQRDMARVKELQRRRGE